MPELEPASDDPDVYEMWTLSVSVLGAHMPRSDLYRENKDKKVISYRPLQKANGGEWLIDVDSRVYVVEESILERGMGGLEV